MKKLEYVAGILGILFTLSVILYYQNVHVIEEVEEPMVEEEESEDMRKGYKEPEEAVAYLMAQIAGGDLERALRVCAVEDVAGYFDTPLYLEYTEDYQGMDMIPPGDNDEGYNVIARLRLASDYGHMLQACMEELASDGSVEVYEIRRDEPENPDGKYYQRLESISNILGARDVCECIVYLKAGDAPKEMHLSLAKYKSYWKVVSFSTMKQYRRTKPDIRTSRADFSEEAMDLEEYREEQLPMNYILMKSRTEADPDRLVSNYYIYLQRGDVLSALTYHDFGNGGEEPVFSLELLDRQKEAAVRLQDLYYQMFLRKTDFEWAKRHYYDTPGYIPAFLRMSNMQYVDFIPQGMQYVDGEDSFYQLGWLYDGEWYSRRLYMAEQDGWRILSMEY